MSKKKKLYKKAKQSPKNVRLKELCSLALHVGFELSNQEGSHMVYIFPSTGERMNYQSDKGDSSKAKSYQVKQLVDFIEDHDLVEE